MKNEGDVWEARAQSWLEQQGLLTITRNFRRRTGEIDLVMLDDKQLVFVEVRKRRPSRFVTAAASIDHRKRARLRRTALLFLQAHRHYAGMNCRFDVLAWDISAEQSAQPTWLRGAFDDQ